jgi:hypothetical protein
MEEMNPFKAGEPKDLLVAFTGRLLKWREARDALHRAQVGDTSVTEWNAAELAVEEAAADVEAIRQHGVALLALLFRWAADAGLELDQVGVPGAVSTTIRDQLDHLAERQTVLFDMFRESKFTLDSLRGAKTVGTAA